MTTPEQNKELVRKFYDEAFTNQNLDYLEDALSDDFIDHPQNPEFSPDKKGAIEGLRFMFGASPDMKVEVLDLIASGNKVAIRARFTGTDSGTGWGASMGAPATGKPYAVEGMEIATVGDDGKLTEHYGLLDVAGMMMQLGLMP